MSLRINPAPTSISCSLKGIGRLITIAHSSTLINQPDKKEAATSSVKSHPSSQLYVTLPSISMFGVVSSHHALFFKPRDSIGIIHGFYQFTLKKTEKKDCTVSGSIHVVTVQMPTAPPVVVVALKESVGVGVSCVRDLSLQSLQLMSIYTMFRTYCIELTVNYLKKDLEIQTSTTVYLSCPVDLTETNAKEKKYKSFRKIRFSN